MSEIHSFPKIFALGQSYIKNIFDDEIEVTEKMDGSQFAFGKINGVLYMRSKGATLYVDNPEKMFKKAIDYIVSIEHLLEDNMIYYCEYISRERHNLLTYGRVPRNYLVLFGLYNSSTDTFHSHDLQPHAEKIDIEHVPVLLKAKVDKLDLDSLLDRESYLGGCKMEGFVVKNYHRPFLLGGQPVPLMMGKFVSESFKEVSKNVWGKENTGKGKWELFKLSHRTEARWLKAIQHLKEANQISFEPKDIGNLLAEIKRDITEEEKDNIKEFLWKEFGEELLRYSCVGFPEFYKRYLADKRG